MKAYVRIPTTWAERNSWAHSATVRPAYSATMVAEADASAMASLREHARRQGIRPVPSYTAIVIKAAALTMAAHPSANRAILGPPFFRRLYQFETSDISVAVEKSLPALPGQAYAEPIRNALTKSLSEITRDLQSLASCDEATNQGYRLFMRIFRWLPPPLAVGVLSLPDWLPWLWPQHRGSACWVNSPSRFGADLVFTTWPWPISFSFGVVRQRPVVVEDRVVPRLTMPLVMVFDRRVMGGGPAGRMFAQFKTLLEHADRELQLGTVVEPRSSSHA